MTAPSAGNRRAGRRLAVCAVYSMECTGYPSAVALPLLQAMKDDNEPWPEFAAQLCAVVEAHGDAIGDQVQAVLENWRMDRVSPIERAILKLGAAEIFHFPDIPPRVTINEYIELAKAYANDNAPPFVNGVLDKLAKVGSKPDFQAPPAPRPSPKPTAEAPPEDEVRAAGAAARAWQQDQASPVPPPADPVTLPPAPVQAPIAPLPPRLDPPASGHPAPPAVSIDLDRVNSRWAREICEALGDLGGSADLMTLCQRIESRRRLPLKENWRQGVLGTIERHSSDAADFEGTTGDPHSDLFELAGPMRWRLRNAPAASRRLF